MTRKPKHTHTAPVEPAPQPVTYAQMARLMLANPKSTAALDDEIALQRQVNERLLSLWDSLGRSATGEDDGALQVKVAAALTAGTGRVAHLLRDQRALSGQAAEGLTAALAQALDELSTELGVGL
jgi:hypothetical protein